MQSPVNKSHLAQHQISKRLQVVTAEDMEDLTPSETDLDYFQEPTPREENTAVNPEPSIVHEIVHTSPSQYSLTSDTHSERGMTKSTLEYGSQSLHEYESIPKDIKILLQSLPFFAGLTGSEEFFETISKALRVRKYRPGDVIIHQGDAAKAMFFIIKGTLKVISEDGEIVVAELESGTYFGEIAILYDVKRTATVVAKTAVTLGSLAAETIQKEMSLYTQISRSIQNQARTRLLSLAKEYEKVGRKVSETLAAQIDVLKKEGSERKPSVRSAIDGLRQNLGADLDIPIIIDNTRSDNCDYISPQNSIFDSDSDYDDDGSLPIIEIHALESIEESPEGTYIDPFLQVPSASITLGSLIPKSSASILSQKLTEKRRASVAVWSDQKLMQFAQNVEKQAVAKESRFAKPLSQCNLVASKESLYLEEGERKGIFVLEVPLLTSIMLYLDLPSLTKLRGVNRYFESLVTDKDLFLFYQASLSYYAKMITNEKLILLCNIIGPNVQVLTLRSCWPITDAGLILMSRLCTKLIYLDLSSVWELSDGGLLQIAETAQLLSYIDLSNCRKITDKGILSLVMHATNLQSINVAYCKNLTGAMMNHLTWSNIKHINFQRCTSIRDNGFVNWQAEGPSGSLSLGSLVFALEELNLSDCSFLTDLTLEALSKKCPQLKRLCLSFCCSLTDNFSTYITNGCPFIETLDVSYCGGAVIDKSVLVLAQGLPKLSTLGVRGCVQLTDTGMAHLAANALSLVNINFTQCRNVSANIEQKLGIKWNCLTSAVFSQDIEMRDYLPNRKYTI